MRYAFYCHGGCQNHGCEAIVRTLSALIKSKDNSSKIKLYTFRKEEDVAAKLPDIDEIEEFIFDRPPTRTGAVQKLKISLYSKQSQKKADEYYYSLSCKNPSLKENDVYISVGGDNYCYGDSHMVIALNKELRRLGKKTVLWGCSIGKEDLTDEKILDLKGYDLIVARETITYNTLIENGVDKNTVLYPDSAFTLKVDENFSKTYPVKENTLGLNISKLANAYSESGRNLTAESATELINYVLDKTSMNVLLIPHVTRLGNDTDILEEVKSKINSERVDIVGGEYNAEQYKSIISRCDLFIGARTHATIAAYSTCVPTLVIGYSVKSEGIARDIFGTTDGYVVPVSALEEKGKLTKEFVNFAEKKDENRAYLEKIMPEYIEKARKSIDELFGI